MALGQHGRDYTGFAAGEKPLLQVIFRKVRLMKAVRALSVSWWVRWESVARRAVGMKDKRC